MFGPLLHWENWSPVTSISHESKTEQICSSVIANELRKKHYYILTHTFFPILSMFFSCWTAISAPLFPVQPKRCMKQRENKSFDTMTRMLIPFLLYPTVARTHLLVETPPRKKQKNNTHFTSSSQWPQTLLLRTIASVYGWLEPRLARNKENGR